MESFLRWRYIDAKNVKLERVVIWSFWLCRVLNLLQSSIQWQWRRLPPDHCVLSLAPMANKRFLRPISSIFGQITVFEAVCDYASVLACLKWRIMNAVYLALGILTKNGFVTCSMYFVKERSFHYMSSVGLPQLLSWNCLRMPSRCENSIQTSI